MTTIVPVIMVGGAGTRLWPLSRRSRPKQFHALVGDRSLLQNTVERVSGTGGDIDFAPPIVVAGETHAEIVRDQLKGLPLGRLVLEPVGRSTAACAVVAAGLVAQSDPATLILLLPSDHHIADGPGFRAAVARAAPAATAGRLVTFGVTPTRAETGFGYVMAEGDGYIRPVARFVEKPDAATAAFYLADGRYLWNAGIFLMRADRLLTEMELFRPDICRAASRALAQGVVIDGALRLDSEALVACPSESLDYAVMERTTDAVVAAINVGWSDIGGFDALWEVADRDPVGNATAGDVVVIDTTNCFITTDGPTIAVLGGNDLIIVARDGIVLVAPKSSAQDIKRLVSAMLERGREALL